MTRRQKIDAAHEVRMWIKDVIVPAGLAAAAIDRINPNLKYDIKKKFDDAKNSIKEKFSKNS